MNSHEMPLDDLIHLAGRDAASNLVMRWRRKDDSDLWFSAEFERKMDTLIHSTGRKDRRLRVLRTALIAAAIVALLAASAMAVPALREAIIRTWITWTGRSADFYSVPLTPAEYDSYDTTNDLEPSYLPAGYQEIDRWETPDMVAVTYSNENDEIEFIKMVGTDGLTSVDSEHCVYSEQTINEITIHIFSTTSDDYPSRVVLTIGEYVVEISGYIEVEELLEMAASIP